MKNIKTVSQKYITWLKTTGVEKGIKEYHKQNSQHMMRTSHVEFIRNVELSSAAVQRNQVVF